MASSSLPLSIKSRNLPQELQFLLRVFQVLPSSFEYSSLVLSFGEMRMISPPYLIICDIMFFCFSCLLICGLYCAAKMRHDVDLFDVVNHPLIESRIDSSASDGTGKVYFLWHTHKLLLVSLGKSGISALLLINYRYESSISRSNSCVIYENFSFACFGERIRGNDHTSSI